MVRPASEGELTEIMKLADKEGFTVIPKNRQFDSRVRIITNKAIIILDPTFSSDLEKFGRKAAETKKAITTSIEKLRSSKKWPMALETLLLDRLVYQCRGCTSCTGFCPVTSHFDECRNLVG